VRIATAPLKNRGGMTDDEIEVQRAQLKEDLRRAQAECDRFKSVEPLPADHTPASPPGFQLAYENLKAAQMALQDFEIEYPAMP
jgi:hypothetical protein